MARCLAATPWGIDARPVEVEVDVRDGLPQLQLVGLPDTAVRESRDRVRSAIKNCGFVLPQRSVVINLAPADLRKEGNHIDLAIALTLLAGHEAIPADSLDGRLICGELGLDGALRPVRGGLGIVHLARRLGMREVMMPSANARLAAALDEVPVIPISGLSEAIEHLIGIRTVAASVPPRATDQDPPSEVPDLAEVRGQETAKRALEIAAAGGHNLLFIGPPGSGKTMLARRLPGLLPHLSQSEAIAVTKLESLVAEEPLPGLVRRRPFRSPHPGISTAAMIGGGGVPRPGEVSLAHAGVLFLDELPEFKRDALEALRQPLEEGWVTVVRTRARMTYPARFALLAAMNPCPCGHLGDPRHTCCCAPERVERYRGRISGPLLDRIDLQIEVPPLSLADLNGRRGESTGAVAERVAAARRLQAGRFAPGAVSPVNAAMAHRDLERHCRLGAAAQKLVEAAFEQLGLSARSLDRVLKVARTIADLAGRRDLDPEHLAEALQYRVLDRRWRP